MVLQDYRQYMNYPHLDARRGAPDAGVDAPHHRLGINRSINK